MTTQDGFFFRFLGKALDRGLVLPSQMPGLVLAYDQVRNEREARRSGAEFSFDCLAEAANQEVISESEGGRLLGLMREMVGVTPQDASSRSGAASSRSAATSES